MLNLEMLNGEVAVQILNMEQLEKLYKEIIKIQMLSSIADEPYVTIINFNRAKNKIENTPRCFPMHVCFEDQVYDGWNICGGVASEYNEISFDSIWMEHVEINKENLLSVLEM